MSESPDTYDRDTRGLGGLIAETLSLLLHLVRGEFSLAQAEIATSMRQAGIGLALMIVAVVLMVASINLLAAALVAGLVHAGLAPVWATLAVGIVLLLVAFILVSIARRALRPSALVPRRALQGLQRDLETLKQGLTE